MTKNSISTVLSVLIALTITSATLALPASAQTASASLQLVRWQPATVVYCQSGHSADIEAHVQNTGTDDVWVKVMFIIFDETGLPPPQEHRFNTTSLLMPWNQAATWIIYTWALVPQNVGMRFYVTGYLFYSPDNVNWYDGGVKSAPFALRVR